MKYQLVLIAVALLEVLNGQNKDMIAFFNEPCQAPWKEYQPLHGRVIVGAYDTIVETN